jgi:hypothetical protein
MGWRKSKKKTINDKIITNRSQNQRLLIVYYIHLNWINDFASILRSKQINSNYFNRPLIIAPIIFMQDVDHE